MKIELLLACAFTTSLANVNAVGEDEKVREMVVYAGKVFDNHDYARRMYTAAFELCGNETNRFARILVDLAKTNNIKIANQSIRLLGFYGGPEQLPFLHACLTNASLASSAAISLLKVEGCTPANMGTYDDFLSNTNITQEARSDFARVLTHAAYRWDFPATNRSLAVNSVLRYAATANEYFLPLDTTLMYSDESYRMSRRRLAVLRSVRDLEINSYQLNYVTNAINELVAYPEADLPE